MRKYSPEDILDAREKRVELQQELLNKFKVPLVVMRVNYPGIDKNNELSSNILEIMEETVASIFQYKINYKSFAYTAEGPISIMLINKKTRAIKNTAIEIEEQHILGRTVDIDVYDEMGNAVSRKDLGCPMRKCYICSDTAQNCVRSKKHSEIEVIQYIKDRYKEYTEKFYGKTI